jgi:hypothetical protein
MFTLFAVITGPGKAAAAAVAPATTVLKLCVNSNKALDNLLHLRASETIGCKVLVNDGQVGARPNGDTIDGRYQRKCKEGSRQHSPSREK